MASPETSNSSSDLFQPPVQPSMSALSVLSFIVSCILVFGGFYLMGLAFDVEHGIYVFGAALAAVALGFWLVFRGND